MFFQTKGLPIPTQDLGRAAFDCGCVTAIRYPSAVPGGVVCFAIFCDRLTGPEFVEIYDPDGNFNLRIP